MKIKFSKRRKDCFAVADPSNEQVTLWILYLKMMCTHKFDAWIYSAAMVSMCS